MKVLLVEDSPDIINTLSLTFRLRWPDAILVCASEGAQGIEMVETESPDIIILDINLPDISGFEVLRQIRLFSNVPVIMLTVRADEVDKIRGLETGADDYITKPFSPLDLLSRVKAVLRRTGVSPENEELSPLVTGSFTIDFSSREIILGDGRMHLTPIEYKILTCLTRNEGKVITQETLKHQVWGSEASYIDPSVIKKYVYQLRIKMGDRSDPPRVILNERGVGYRFVKPK